MLNNSSLKEQKKSLRNILSANKKTKYAEHTGVSTLSESESFTEFFAKYIDLVDVTNHEMFITALRSLEKDIDSNDIKLINKENLLISNPVDHFARTRRGYLRPFDDSSLKAINILEEYVDHAKKSFKIRTKKTDKTFYMFDRAAIQFQEDSYIGEMRALQLSSLPWFKLNKPLPVLKELIPAGQSYNQCLHAMLDQLEKYGKNVTVLVANSKQLVELALLYSQRRGEFATLKNLTPNLKLWINDTGFHSINKKLIDSLFAGLDVKQLDIYNSVTGALALQDTEQEQGILTLQCDIDVFYEFVPVEFVDSKGKVFQGAPRFHVGSVEANKDYLLVVSNKSGIMSMTTTDIVRVVNNKPLQIMYLRRAQSLNELKEGLNTFLIDKIISALNNVLVDYRLMIRDYMIGYDNIEKRHLWILEINKSPDLVDEKLMASVVNRVHKMLIKNAPRYRRAIEEMGLNAPKMFIIPLGGLSIIEKPKGFYCLDISSDAKIIHKYINNNHHKVFQASSANIL